MSVPEFIYLDLGNVLATFDNQRACAQMAQVSGLSEGQLRDLFGQHDYQNKLEQGQVTFEEVVDGLSDAAGKALDHQAMEHAYSDIFGLVPGIVAVVARLASARFRLGVLSNTSAPHWRLVTDGRFAILPQYFECAALSFEIGAMKPHQLIYSEAAKIAGVSASSIFFADDRPENVASAKAVGFDAVQFTGAHQLARELSNRGVRFNY